MKDETKNLAGKKRSHQCLQSVEVFAQLPSNVVAGIAEQSTASTFAAKEKIFSEGERATHGCIVMSGRVAMLKSSPNGKELIFQLFTAGEPFGFVAFLEETSYPMTARSQIPTEVLLIPTAAMAPVLQSFPSIHGAIARIISGRFRESQEFARSLAHDRVEIRVASILRKLLPKLSFLSPLEPQVMDLQLGRQELADLAGITIETASRVIKRFEQDGILETSLYGYLRFLDLPKLELLLGEIGNSF